jgi:hypothetical protein
VSEPQTYSPAFVELFYLSANHIKFTYLIKENKMKDIKSYVIGFLTCACMFLIMGQMPAMGDEQIEQMKNMANQMKNAGLMPERVGKYQIAPNSQTRDIYLLDTVSGETYISKSSKGEWEKHISGL